MQGRSGRDRDRVQAKLVSCFNIIMTLLEGRSRELCMGGGCFFIVFCSLRFDQPTPHSVLKGRASRAMCRGHPYCGGRGSQFGEIADRLVSPLVGTTAFTSSLLAPIPNGHLTPSHMTHFPATRFPPHTAQSCPPQRRHYCAFITLPQPPRKPNKFVPCLLQPLACRILPPPLRRRRPRLACTWVMPSWK